MTELLNEYRQELVNQWLNFDKDTHVINAAIELATYKAKRR